MIVSSFVAISVTLALKLLDSLVKETNSITINKFKNPITLSLWSDSFLIKLNLQTKTPKYKIDKNPPQRKTHSSAIKEQILLKKITFCAPPISGLWDINCEITKCYKFTDVQFKYFWHLTFNTIIIMWKYMCSIWQFSLHLKSYTGEDAGPSVGERKTWRWA